MAVAQGIQSAAELKGKSVGTDLPGTVTNYQTQVMLGKLGLKDSDVQMVRLQGSEAVYAGLLAGQIQGAPIAVPQLFQAEGKGYKVLTDTFDIKYQNIGPVVLKSRLNELRPRLTAFMLGIRDGMQAFVAQPDAAKKLIGTNTKESDDAILQQTYDFYSKTTQFNTSLQPTMEGIQSMIDFLAASTLPAAKGAKPEQFVDSSILNALPAG
jgi:ABC-type nitrate/sulfonate/bicarbonate transport system substrate-binding protein